MEDVTTIHMRHEEADWALATGSITWKHLSLKTSSYFSVDKERVNRTNEGETFWRGSDFEKPKCAPS